MILRIGTHLSMLIFLFVVFLSTANTVFAALPNGSACTSNNDCDSYTCDPAYRVCVRPSVPITNPTYSSGPIDFKPNVPIPGYQFQPGDTSTGNIARWVKAIYNYAISIVGIVAALAMVFGGFIWLTAGGNPSKVGEAQAWIGSALTGLVLALGSWLLFNTINPDLVKFKVKGIEGINPIQTGSNPTPITGCCDGRCQVASNEESCTQAGGTWRSGNYNCNGSTGSCQVTSAETQGCCSIRGSSCSNMAGEAECKLRCQADPWNCNFDMNQRCVAPRCVNK